MKQAITESYFIEQIVGDEYNSMTYEGAKALFGWVEELEADTGEEMEFDRVAIRCYWTEYENIGMALNEYYDLKTVADLSNNTVVIEIPDTDRLLVQEF